MTDQFTSQPPVAELRDVHRTYVLGGETVRALDGVSFCVTSGEYVAIMGPSGSGKSTMLNVLGCLDRPTDGVYELAGRDVSQMSDDELSEARSLHLGFVFQSYNLIPQLTVLENIQVPLYYRHDSDSRDLERCRVLAEKVGLGERLHHRPTELSGGQQQRVALARALANDPVLILADEPTGNLDTHTEAEVLDLMDELNAEGKAIILVTHEDNVAERAQRTIHLLDGRVAREEVG